MPCLDLSGLGCLDRIGMGCLDKIGLTCLDYSGILNLYDLDKTKERLAYILKRKTDKIFIADIDGITAGYIHASDYECTYADSLKNIMAIAVFEEYRGQGVGKALLTAVEDWASAAGCAGVRLVSGMNRMGAHEFYQHCGYNVRKLQKNFIKLF